jgi:DNA (cytosine-5)-methyltransferase 1
LRSEKTQLVLSLFPGIDLLGRGFEAEGFCVVRGPDKIFGGDIHSFEAPAGRFDGVIAGTPCQDYSTARRSPPTGDSDLAIAEFARVVTFARPAWWLLENVPAVPDLRIAGYSHLRIDLNARECGSPQWRPRHFQFGHVAGLVPVVTRRPMPATAASRCAIASEFSHLGRRGWADFCELQGLPRWFRLDDFTRASRYRAVGNGVDIRLARTIAAAIRAAVPPDGLHLCACGCARFVTARRTLATPACRKRMQRKRDSAGVTGTGPLTRARSQVLAPAVTDRSPREPGPSPVTDQAAVPAGASPVTDQAAVPAGASPVTDQAAVPAGASLVTGRRLSALERAQAAAGHLSI